MYWDGFDAKFISYESYVKSKKITLVVLPNEKITIFTKFWKKSNTFGNSQY